MAAKKKVTEGETKVIELVPILEQEMLVTMVGTSMLCVNRFSEKAKKQMIEKQTKKNVKGGKVAREPEKDWKAAHYLDSKGRPMIPAHNLKSALVYAAHQDKGITKVNAKAGIFVMGMDEPGCLIIKGDVIPFDIEDVDTVMIGGRNPVADLRWRPKWTSWSLDLRIKFDPTKISETQLLALLFEAGRMSGLGEGRPQKSTLSWGMFAPDLESIKRSEPRNIMEDIDAAVKRAKVIAIGGKKVKAA